MEPQRETVGLLDPRFEAETDRLTGTVARNGNSVTLLPSGAQSYERRWKLIEEARRSIDVVSFSVMNDDTSRRMRDVLLAKLRQGVKVRMVVDDAVLYSTFSAELLDQLAAAGAQVIRYHRVFRDWLPDLRKGEPFRQLLLTGKYKLKRRFHEKYMIADGREVILGGINWGDKYAFGGVRPEAWRDSDVHLTGPVVADIQRQFIRSFHLYTAMESEYAARRERGFDRDAHYAKARRDAKTFIAENPADYFPPLPETGTDRVRYVPHKPYDEEKLPLTDAVLQMLRAAQKTIYWGCHGIRPPRILAETLAAAVARGVEVRLITNSRISSRSLMASGLLGFMYRECANHFHWLLERGVRIFEWQKPGAFHSKNLVIDEAVASVGSYNIANGSAFHHTESNVIVYGGPFAGAVLRQFDVDLQDCREIKLADARAPSGKWDPFRRPLHRRNLLVERSLLPESVRLDLDAGRYDQDG